MNFTGFIGASYRSLSKYAGVERCVNFYLEVIEDPHETKTRMTLYPTPCTGAYSAKAAGVFAQIARGSIVVSAKPGANPVGSVDRYFGVNGSTFFEFLSPTSDFPQGQWVQWGSVANDSKPVNMIANGVTSGQQQLFFTCANKGYIFNLNTNTFVALTLDANGFEGGHGAAFLDDYFISLIPETNGVVVSAINDGTNWGIAGTNNPTINVSYTQGQSDALSQLIANQEYLYLFGYRRSEVWYNNGQFFPFAIQPGAFIENGLGAQYALVQADNTLQFLGQDMRGSGSIWKLNGITPVRISTFAVELALQNYAKTSTIADCISYAFLWRGHIFVRYIFPTAKAGWTYDCTASNQLGYSVWHENTLTDNNGNTFAPIERTHAYFNGVHVVGSGPDDPNPGTLYQFTDATILPADPQTALRLSDDGGQTFGNEQYIAVGEIGQYDIRCIADTLGAGRDRVFWVRCVDYGDAAGSFPIIRDRIAPHISNENRWVYYHRLELEFQKGIGSLAGVETNDAFWAIVAAYLQFETGLT